VAAAKPVARTSDAIEPELAEIALNAGIPATAITECKKTILRRHGSSHISSERLENAATAIAHLARELEDAVNTTPDLAAMRGLARDYLLSGRFSDTELVLARAEDHDIKAAQTDLAITAAHLKSAARTRTWRGKLQEALHDYRRAARHYGLAVRHVPRGDHAARWHFSKMQVEALIAAEAEFADKAALNEAAKICSETIVLLHDNDCKLPRAEAKGLLGRLLIRQGAQYGDLSALASARRHLTDAAQQFEEAGEVSAAHAVLQRRADACRLFGEARSDESALSEAVTIYEMLLEVADNAGEPETSMILRRKLGLAMAALGVKLKNDKLLETARETLELEYLAGSNDEALTAGMTEAALGRALFALGLLRNDDEPVKKAIRIMRRALLESDAAGSSVASALMRNDLANMLRHRAEASGEPSAIDEVRVLKAEALLGLGDDHEALAEDVRLDLARLDDEVCGTTAVANG
ncbi:MAG: hypothetical protein KDJ36_12255, partial [Hyphomicrobiaceae bacterium]|nr:hypothetical protein [Hyphomicrobiaceae bacterium]